VKISDYLNQKTAMISFEVFPPKTSENFESVKTATENIAKLNPGFMSVTYGAGGSTQRYTNEIAENTLRRGTVPLAHLTCVNATRESVVSQLSELKSRGITPLMISMKFLLVSYIMSNIVTFLLSFL